MKDQGRSLRWPGVVRVLLLACLLAACQGVGVTESNPANAKSTIKAGLTVHVAVRPADSVVSRSLGWGRGIPGATVYLDYVDGPFQWQKAETDSLGNARLPRLLPGYYRLAAYRRIPGDSAQALGGHARALATGEYYTFPGADSVELDLRLDRPGSLVISEVYGIEAPVSEAGNYDVNGFIELYNNADTTIYLDGKILGTSQDLNHDFGTYTTCANSEPWLDDPAGLWARYWHRFPGTGHDYPLLPGRTAVVAVNAVDHSKVYPAFPDLSHADFELLGPADVDNPAVPNMPEDGLGSYPGGSGMQIEAGVAPYFVADPVDKSTLQQRDDCRLRSCYEYALIPADHILDVVLPFDDEHGYDAKWPPCAHPVPAKFDALPAEWLVQGRDMALSYQRPVLYTVGGRAVLQDTNTSAMDFFSAPFTPGSVP